MCAFRQPSWGSCVCVFTAKCQQRCCNMHVYWSGLDSQFSELQPPSVSFPSPFFVSSSPFSSSLLSNLYAVSNSSGLTPSVPCLPPQSSRGEMTWSLWATFSCTSTWALCPGRGSRLPPRGRSMNASVRRKCPPPLRCSARDTPVSIEKLKISATFLTKKPLQLTCFVFKIHFFSCVFQLSSPLTWICVARCGSMTNRTTHTWGSFSGTFSTDRASPTTTFLTGTCWSLWVACPE